MALIYKHQTWIEGAKKFGEWLDGIDKVADVKQGGIRDSKVKSRRREPEVKTSKTSVMVDFYAEGSIQRLFCYPVDGTSLHGLARGIRKALAEKNQRGGVGQSSKEEIDIPEYIRRKQEETRRREMKKEGVAEIQPTKEEKEILLTERLVQGYEFLLGLAPSPDAKEFKISKARGKLGEKFGSNIGNSMSSNLVAKGLLIPLDSRKGVGREGKEFTVFRKPYRIVLSKKPALVPVQPGEEKPSKARRKKDTVMGYIEAIEEGIKSLKEFGFKVILGKNGKVTLRR